LRRLPITSKWQTAVSLVPDGFDENRALADARAALRDNAGARAALHVAAAAVSRMKPEARNILQAQIDKKLEEIRP